MSYNILSSGTNVSNYLNWIRRYTGIEIVQENKEVCDEESNSCFLSIITRTQGKRPEALAETILSLTAQTDMDFELLILGHNLDENQKTLVEDIIDDLPGDIKDRTRLIEVNGGTRTTPLNVGFEAAKGNYIAILDDDDIVFDNWVESFKDAAKKQPGSVLHAYSLSQKWMTVKINNDLDGLRAVAAHTDEFCKKFDWIDEVNINTCPPVGLAFPAYAFKELGIKFDETLNTTEDWDFLMRTAFITGVVDIEEPTCIYRLWQNAENSQTLHSPEEWKKNHMKIIDKFHEVPLLLPVGYTKKLIWNNDSIEKNNNEKNNSQIDGRLYYNMGRGFNTNDSIAIKYACNEIFDVDISLDSSINGTCSFRWDPMDDGNFYIKDLSILTYYEDGSSENVKSSKISSNGYFKDDKYIFIFPDPQIYFNTKGFPIKINIKGRLIKNTENEYSCIVKKNPNTKYKLMKIKNRIFKR